VFELSPSDYAGGVGVWGAAPPLYDTSGRPYRRGVHVHARRSPSGKKCLDGTYPAVRVIGEPDVVISAADALFGMCTTIAGLSCSQVQCTHCGQAHLDEDLFSVRPHRKHLCEHCGRYFHDRTAAVGNPAGRLRRRTDHRTSAVPADGILEIDQQEYPGGVQVWASNPALLWTSEYPEHVGIHVHAYVRDKGAPTVDDTFSRVTIDGVELDPNQLRVLMAQRLLPFLDGRVVSAACSRCGRHGSSDPWVPTTAHACPCGSSISIAGRMKKVVLNPMVAALERLGSTAIRPPIRHLCW
jgi:hypothetical protein